MINEIHESFKKFQVPVVRLILDSAVQVPTTQVEQEQIMQTNAFIEKRKPNIY